MNAHGSQRCALTMCWWRRACSSRASATLRVRFHGQRPTAVCREATSVYDFFAAADIFLGGTLSFFAFAVVT